MEFVALSASELTSYLQGIPAVNALLGEPAEIDIAEVGDGNLNYVYYASNARAPEKSVVVKQAPPFLRLVGKTWPLSRVRMEREVAALRRFGSLCPQHVPKVLHEDSELFLMVMQRLSNHRILRQGLIDGVVYPKFCEHISTYLAHTLFFGSDLFLASDIKKRAMKGAVNTELCAITEALVFTYPFEDHPSNIYSPALPRKALQRLRQTASLRIAAGEMKWAFMNHAETLVHGDLHTGSIMVNQEETYVIDPEFSFYGPMAFDLAAVLANLLLAYFSRDWHGRIDGARPEMYQAWLLDQIRDVWSSFTEKFLTLWREHEGRSKTSFMGGDLDTGLATAFKARFMQRLLSDTLGFAGCKMIRRIVGLAKVAEITRITDPIARAAIEVRCLFCAEKLLTERESLTSIEQVLQLAHELRSSKPE